MYKKSNATARFMVLNFLLSNNHLESILKIRIYLEPRQKKSWIKFESLVLRELFQNYIKVMIIMGNVKDKHCPIISITLM